MSSPERIIPGPIAPFLQDIDRITIPLMHRIGILNDTRAWHVQTIDPELVDLDLASVTSRSAGPDATPVYDQDRSILHAAGAHLHQLPRGRKEYTVFDIESLSSVRAFDLFAGYVSRRLSDDTLIKAELIKYPFQGPRFRMLDATPGTYTAHFVVDNAGSQLATQKIGAGMLGKHDQHRNVPLR